MGWIGGDQWQFESIGKVDQPTLGRFLDRIAAPRQFDIQTLGENRLQSPGVGTRFVGLSVGE
jgi:hypothetical protein